jgi:hypothetical protein
MNTISYFMSWMWSICNWEGGWSVGSLALASSSLRALLLRWVGTHICHTSTIASHWKYFPTFCVSRQMILWPLDPSLIVQLESDRWFSATNTRTRWPTSPDVISIPLLIITLWYGGIRWPSIFISVSSGSIVHAFFNFATFTDRHQMI